MKTIIANPPFSITWEANESLLKDVRFSEYGKLAPRSKADYAFIQDMIYELDNSGIMVVVLPHGVLFRGSSELHIRRYLIESKNYLDAVIGLPPNIFYGTSIPTCILVFKKNRIKSDPVIFIDASKEFEKQKNKNTMLDSHIDRIVNVYSNRSSVDKFSSLVSLAEIRDNDYNLNIPRYIDTFEDEEEIDIYAVMNEIDRLEKNRKKLDAEIKNYMIELGIIEKPLVVRSNQIDLFDNICE